MNLLTEKIFKKLNKFLEERAGGKDLPEAEMNKLIQRFMDEHNVNLPTEPLSEKNAETVEDYLELIHGADSVPKMRKILKKAEKLFPDSTDIQLMAVQGEPVAYKRLQRVGEIVDKERKRLEKEGYFEKSCIGHFWLEVETRPFMRAYYSYAKWLRDDGHVKQAIVCYEEMLKLCDSDNLGVRYALMHAYAALEDEDGAKKLSKIFDDDASVSFFMPQMLLYYRLGKLDKAGEIMKEIYELNANASKFFAAYGTNRFLKPGRNALPNGMYAFGSIEEFNICYVDNDDCYAAADGFMLWCKEEVKKFASDTEAKATETAKKTMKKTTKKNNKK